MAEILQANEGIMVSKGMWNKLFLSYIFVKRYANLFYFTSCSKKTYSKPYWFPEEDKHGSEPR